jgi:hypothetical protein
MVQSDTAEPEKFAEERNDGARGRSGNQGSGESHPLG